MKSQFQQFTDWVAQQDPAATYDYWDTCGCAVFRFLEAHGYPVAGAGGYGDWEDRAGNQHVIPNVPAGAIVREPWTFGALSARLRGEAG